MICEQRLIKLCSIHSFVYIYHVADLYNANRLKEFCQWYQRINPTVNELLQRAAEEEAKGGGLDFSNVSSSGHDRCVVVVVVYIRKNGANICIGGEIIG